MSNLLDHIWWFIIAYPVLGLIIIVLSTTYTKPIISSRIISFTEIINVVFGICLLTILINSLFEAKESTGNYFYRDVAEWFWYVPICMVLGLLCFKKIRRINFSILLFSLIIFIGYCLFINFFKLEPGV